LQWHFFGSMFLLGISYSLNENYSLCDTNNKLSTKFRKEIKLEIKLKNTTTRNIN